MADGIVEPGCAPHKHWLLIISRRGYYPGREILEQAVARELGVRGAVVASTWRIQGLTLAT